MLTHTRSDHDHQALSVIRLGRERIVSCRLGVESFSKTPEQAEPFGSHAGVARQKELVDKVLIFRVGHHYVTHA
jgi:hypothetical protein